MDAGAERTQQEAAAMSTFSQLLGPGPDEDRLPMGLSFTQEIVEGLDLSELEFRDAVFRKCRFLGCDFSGAAFFGLPAGGLRPLRLPSAGQLLAGLPSHRLQGRRRGLPPQPPAGHGADRVSVPVRPLHRRPLGSHINKGM